VIGWPFDWNDEVETPACACVLSGGVYQTSDQSLETSVQKLNEEKSLVELLLLGRIQVFKRDLF
jgi:hypothetical protein